MPTQKELEVYMPINPKLKESDLYVRELEAYFEPLRDAGESEFDHRWLYTVMDGVGSVFDGMLDLLNDFFRDLDKEIKKHGKGFYESFSTEALNSYLHKRDIPSFILALCDGDLDKLPVNEWKKESYEALHRTTFLHSFSNSMSNFEYVKSLFIYPPAIEVRKTYDNILKHLTERNKTPWLMTWLPPYIKAENLCAAFKYYVAIKHSFFDSDRTPFSQDLYMMVLNGKDGIQLNYELNKIVNKEICLQRIFIDPETLTKYNTKQLLLENAKLEMETGFINASLGQFIRENEEKNEKSKEEELLEASLKRDFIRPKDEEGRDRDADISKGLQLLGLPADASDSDKRKAYRALAMKYHPDKNPAIMTSRADELMALLTLAYEAVMKPEGNTSDLDLDKWRESKAKFDRGEPLVEVSCQEVPQGSGPDGSPGPQGS